MADWNSGNGSARVMARLSGVVVVVLNSAFVMFVDRSVKLFDVADSVMAGEQANIRLFDSCGIGADNKWRKFQFVSIVDEWNEMGRA